LAKAHLKTGRDALAERPWASVEAEVESEEVVAAEEEAVVEEGVCPVFLLHPKPLKRASK